MNQHHDHGLDVEFQKFQPSPQILHYRNPNAYNEMLQIVASLEMKKIVDELSSCEAFSLQVDGSVDKYQVDNKFITARYMDKERAMKSVFLGEAHSPKRGADGLLDAVVINLEERGLKETAIAKLTSLTTDGENANTGRRGGLWVKLREYLGRDILCFWCIGHRSDLVIDDLKATVSEFKHWHLNLKSVATFYRASAVCTNELENIAILENKKAVHFHKFH